MLQGSESLLGRASPLAVLGLLSAATVGCARCDGGRADGGVHLPPATAATDTPEASPEAPPAWPSFSGDEHCVSLRKIAGYLRLVPAWISDAGYVTTWPRDASFGTMLAIGDDITAPLPLDGGDDRKARGKEVPSGFSACLYSRSRGVSVNWSVGYECATVAAPNDAAARARFSEIQDTWRRCFHGTALRETDESPTRLFGFAKPLPPWHRVGCSLQIKGSTILMHCGESENN